MKINIKERFIVADIKETKNPRFQLIILGAKDFSGTTSFIVNVEEMSIDFGIRDEVEVEFFVQISNQKINDEYKEVINNK